MDMLSPQRRSELMSRIKDRDTGPEMKVRRLLHRLGYRYQACARSLPGRPDLVFRRRRRVIFVHGCFWHRHEGYRHATTPASNCGYWLPKLAANRARDARNIAALAALGWEVLVVWECEIKAPGGLLARLTTFLGPPARPLPEGLDDGAIRNMMRGFPANAPVRRRRAGRVRTRASRPGASEVVGAPL